MNILERFESVAQNYVRSPRIVFDRAEGAELFDEAGNRYVDFFAGGSCLSYGHNNARVRDALIDYLSSGRVLQTGGRTSAVKRQFIELFFSTILEPRNLDYRILFTDPAGGTAVETAIRLARRYNNRANIVAFTNACHGVTEGALAVTSKGSRHLLPGTKAYAVFMPFCGYFGGEIDTIAYFRRFLADSASGIDLPAAAIVETTQVHGGVHVASVDWLKALEQVCREYKILLIIDDTHVGCGRVGPYFSFELAGINPDIVIGSNAMAAGLPASMLLLKPELDVWRPGEQVGAFQGDSLTFVAAIALLSQWTHTFSAAVTRRGDLLRQELSLLARQFNHGGFSVRGHGMVWALDFQRPGSAAVISAWALERGLLVEPARLRDEVLLVMPPLMIDDAMLLDGLERLRKVVSSFLSHPPGARNFTQSASIGHKS